MKNRHESETAETPEQLIEQISRLMAEAEAMLAGPVTEKTSTKFEDLKERLSSARETLNEVYSSARESLGDAYTSVRKNVVKGAKYTDETIRNNPYQSIAIAVGLGVVIGMLIRRNNH